MMMCYCSYMYIADTTRAMLVTTMHLHHLHQLVCSLCQPTGRTKVDHKQQVYVDDRHQGQVRQGDSCSRVDK